MSAVAVPSSSVARRTAAALAAAPVTPLLLAAVALFLAWVPLDGGQPLTRWVPGALLLLGLLALAALAVPGRFGAAPRPVRAAVLLLAAYTAWSALSIAWADNRAAALEGADRTLLYLVTFTLFALWPQRGRTAVWVLGAWAIGLGLLALDTLLRVRAGTPSLFADDRLADPAGYPNAAAATWLMGLWPAITLAACRRVAWPVRALLAGLAVVLAEVALLSQSRGSTIAVPVCLLLLVALVPGRLRTLAVLVPVGIAVGAAAPSVLDLGPALVDHDLARVDALSAALARNTLLAALGAALVVGVLAAVEARRPPAPATAARIRRAWAVVVVAGAIVLVAGGVVVAGNPVERARHAWTSFKGGYAEDPAGSRLASGLGSNRYDFFRVALDLFAEHPVAGIGADNFFEDYLARRHSDETPRYPHSWELRALAQTGLVGAALLLAALGAALAAGWRALRGADPLAVATAGGGVMAFAYWLVHGSADWFWEWAGLGAPAFAFLGLACALAPRPPLAPGTAAPAAPAVRGTPALVALAGVVLAAAVALCSPWLAEREVRWAGAVFATRPLEAYDRLDRAAALDPWAERPPLVEGSIALRYGDLPRAQRAFERALARDPRNEYGTLELGAIASVRGDRRRAEALLARAVALSPRDPLAREAHAIVQRGGTVSLVELNRRILLSAERLGAG